MAKRQGKRGIPPSRQRYEESHPTVTVRVSREIYNQLLEIREATGQSWADLMKVALKLQKPVLTRKPNEAELHISFEQGWEHAWNEYALVVPCSKCGKDITVNSDNKQSAIEYLKSGGFQHQKCQ